MADPFPTSVSVDTATLSWVRAAATSAVSAEFAESVHPEIAREEIWGSLVHRLTARVLAEELPPERVERSDSTTFDRPATWWQAWKAEHPRIWRGWLLTRWPICMVNETRTLTLSVDLRRYWSYPQQTVAHPRLGNAVRLATYNAGVTWAGGRG